MLIYPAIDLVGGRAVRLRQGRFEDQTDYGDPLDAAKSFEDAGSEWVHMVDLEGAKGGEPRHQEIAVRIKQKTRLKLQWGGGLRNRKHCEELISLGADRVILGSTLLKDPNEALKIIRDFGPQVAAGIDMRGGLAAAAGWLEQTDVSGLALAQHLAEEGVGRVIITDIARDGELQGPNLEMMREFVAAVPVPVIASGGVSTLSDIAELKTLQVEGAIVGKALYERAFSLTEAIRAAS